MEYDIEPIVTATRVPEAERLDFLPRHFGQHLMVFEQTLYTQMGRLCAGYSGGYWEFYDLSNGGCYLAPSGTTVYRVRVSSNYFEGDLSADAAGITATLYAINSLTFRYPQVRRHVDRYHQLRDFACGHAQASLILAAID